MKHAIIDANNLVVSMVIWPNGNFKCPRDHQSIQSDIARVGDRYDNGQFIKPDGSVRS